MTSITRTTTAIPASVLDGVKLDKESRAAFIKTRDAHDKVAEWEDKAEVLTGESAAGRWNSIASTWASNRPGASAGHPLAQRSPH